MFLIKSMYFASKKRDEGQCYSKPGTSLAKKKEFRST